ncbi:hypothetical protein [Algoriphagus sp. Y33]|nr:hypothetical protein [Algoriphagus sp. Y33]
MKKSRFTETQILKVLQSQQGGSKGWRSAGNTVFPNRHSITGKANMAV